ncbi:RES domain-containing protein [Massilia endophytica]|uniref:RES domain-containing protein n=1 Tax=Massilia endophytica TaxID=2899220 RepID=UPI001E538FCC|nr:RES domain-containing protein [Massilia endophytica]UGQ45443.1 RES domain-containing protein [Massilia endophytica]
MHGNIKKALLHKAQELNRCASEHLSTVQAIVGELDAHVDGRTKVDESRIADLVSKLTRFTLGVPVSIPLESNTHFTRGVKYSEGDNGRFYRTTSRLSYIPEDLAHRAPQGRLNAAKEPVFYASLDTQSASVSAVLAEINAVTGDVVNFLYSTTRRDHAGALHVIPIGIMAYFKRGVPVPFSLHPSFRAIHQFLCEQTDPVAMSAIHLCDDFMDTLLCAPVIDNDGREKPGLYDVTSALARDFLATPILDGILYQSTKSEQFPNVALKPKAVIEKLTYVAASAYRVVDTSEEFGYSLQCLGNGIVDGENIIWLP